MKTFSVWIVDRKFFSKPKVFLSYKKEPYRHTKQSPILIKRAAKYLFYAVHYQDKPERKNLGTAIWEGTSLTNPNFYLKEVKSCP